MLKAGLLVPLLELCCNTLETRAAQQSEDTLRCTMLVVHEVLKNRPLHGMADFLHGLSPEQVWPCLRPGPGYCTPVLVRLEASQASQSPTAVSGCNSA